MSFDIGAKGTLGIPNLFERADNKIMEEETYEVTGDVQAQKNAIYEQWLDGAYERIGATAKVLLPAVQSMTKFVWMCVFGSGAHLKVCGHALLVAPLVPGPGRPFDDEFSTLGCRGRSVARPPVAEGRVRKVW